jgi:hypothetical protein
MIPSLHPFAKTGHTAIMLYLFVCTSTWNEITIKKSSEYAPTIWSCPIACLIKSIRILLAQIKKRKKKPHSSGHTNTMWFRDVMEVLQCCTYMDRMKAVVAARSAYWGPTRWSEPVKGRAYLESISRPIPQLKEPIGVLFSFFLYINRPLRRFLSKHFPPPPQAIGERPAVSLYAAGAAEESHSRPYLKPHLLALPRTICTPVLTVPRFSPDQVRSQHGPPYLVKSSSTSLFGFLPFRLIPGVASLALWAPSPSRAPPPSFNPGLCTSTCSSVRPNAATSVPQLLTLSPWLWSRSPRAGTRSRSTSLSSLDPLFDFLLFVDVIVLDFICIRHWWLIGQPHTAATVAAIPVWMVSKLTYIDSCCSRPLKEWLC